MTSRAVPAPSRHYWICQAAGSGGFLAYVLGGYWLFAHGWEPGEIAAIVLTNGVLFPALTHGLRWMIHRRGWLELTPVRIWIRLATAIVILTGAIGTLVVGEVLLLDRSRLPGRETIFVYWAYGWAFTGWCVIYYIVQARRRRDALHLQLTMAARDAQLQSLRAQLNPHFLFNCLNSLRHLTLTKPEQAATMVTGLAELLRYSLAVDRADTVPLAEELRIVNEYLDLERIRFEERLHVEQAVEPAAFRARIPPMLVQTLVDNAIKHGIAERPAGGVVRIACTVLGDRLKVVVTNTGPLTSPPSDGGHGLRNARERLRLLYGDKASLTLTGIEGDTQASVTMPFELEHPHERAAG